MHVHDLGIAARVAYVLTIGTHTANAVPVVME